jgi:hypothetical protein
MFNPHLSVREKELDRQDALARAEQSRRVRLAKGHRESRRWQLPVPMAAAFHSLWAFLMRQRRSTGEFHVRTEALPRGR